MKLDSATGRWPRRNAIANQRGGEFVQSEDERQQRVDTTRHTRTAAAGPRPAVQNKCIVDSSTGSSRERKWKEELLVYMAGGGR